MAAGAEVTGRDVSDIDLIVPVFAAPGDTPEERERAVHRARTQIAFYGSTPNYAFQFDDLGFEGTTPKLGALVRKGDIDAIPELKWMFDCGSLVCGWKPKRIFLSHTHKDHVHYLTHMKSNDKKHPPVVLLPTRAAPLVQSYLTAHQAMIDCFDENLQEEEGNGIEELQLLPTEPDEEIVIRNGGSEYICRTVACEHRIDCLGYSIFNVRKTLKEEFVGLPGKEIGRLRKEGTEITTSREEPFVCFLGDTTHGVFERYPLLLQQHKIVIVECSFIDDASVERSKVTKHMHWNFLRPFVEAHPRTLFVLTHFSLKYSSLELRRFFCEQSKHKNIHTMLIESEVQHDWEKDGSCTGKAPSCNCFVCTSGR